MNLYKKLGVKKTGAKPGDLLSALNAKKANGAVAAFKKHPKHKKSHSKHEKMHHCAQCQKAHSKHMKHEKRHGKNWIAGAIGKPGALHREMGVKEGHKIPAGRLRAAAKKGGKEGKRARLAETLKGFHHKKQMYGGVGGFKKRSKGSKHRKAMGRTSPQLGSQGSGPMVGSVGGYKKRGKHEKKN